MDENGQWITNPQGSMKELHSATNYKISIFQNMPLILISAMKRLKNHYTFGEEHMERAYVVFGEARETHEGLTFIN